MKINLIEYFSYVIFMHYKKIERTMNPFDTLGIEPTTDASAIKKAYRAAMKAYHPDQNPDNPIAAEKFQQAQDAWEELKNPASAQRHYNAAQGQKNHSGTTQHQPWMTKDIFEEWIRTNEAVKRAFDKHIRSSFSEECRSRRPKGQQQKTRDSDLESLRKEILSGGRKTPKEILEDVEKDIRDRGGEPPSDWAEQFTPPDN